MNRGRGWQKLTSKHTRGHTVYNTPLHNWCILRILHEWHKESDTDKLYLQPCLDIQKAKIITKKKKGKSTLNIKEKFIINYKLIMHIVLTYIQNKLGFFFFFFFQNGKFIMSFHLIGRIILFYNLFNTTITMSKQFYFNKPHKW